MSRRTRDELLNAVNKSFAALFSAADETEARGHKLGRTVLAEARKGEQEAIELARKWADSPTNFFDNFEAVVEVQARAQRRALELARDTVGGAGEYGGELRRALGRLVTANRQAAGAVVDAVRDRYAGLSGRVRREVEELRPVVTRPSRRRARTTRRHAAAPPKQAVEALVS